MSASSILLRRDETCDAARAPLVVAHQAGAAVMPLTCDLVTTRAAFDALEPDWNALFDRSATGIHLFQSFNWLWHWANNFLPKDGEPGPELAIVTLRRGGRLVLVWPMVRERHGPVTKLSWMGEPVSQYGDVLIDTDEDALALLKTAWARVSSEVKPNLVQLRKVRADAKVFAFLEALGARAVEELIAPYLDLTEAPSFEVYEQRYSSNARRNRRRQRRRFMERGRKSLVELTAGQEARHLATTAIDMKRVWLNQRGLVSPALADPRTKAFFADVAEARERPAGCHVLALCSNDRPAAVEVGIECKGRSAIHIIVYDPDFEKTAAGALLMEDSIRAAFSRGCKAYDFLAPGDGYKLDWADQSIRVCDWSHPLDAVGTLYTVIYLGWVRSIGKKLLTSLPHIMRRHLMPLTLALMICGDVVA